MKNYWGFNLRRLAIRAKLRRNPYYRIQSVEEVQVAAELGWQIDVNRATVDDWLRLPGISIHQARSLVELVNMGVPLLCLEDLAAALSIPIQRLKPLESLLNFVYYDPESLSNPQKIDPNQASFQQLAQIPLLEKTIATAIITNRQQYGKYRNLADLQRRLNLTSQLTAQLMYYLVINN